MNDTFPSPLTTIHNIADSRQTLAFPLICNLGEGRSVTVPVGFVTDLASVPRCLQWLYPPAGRYTYPSVVHDWLCAKGQVVESLKEYNDVVDLSQAELPIMITRDGAHGSLVYSVQRREADRILRELMKATGCRWHTRWLFWAAVRINAIRNILCRQ